MKTLQKIEIISAFTFAFLCGMLGLFLLISCITGGPSIWIMAIGAILLITIAWMLIHDGIKAVRELKEK